MDVKTLEIERMTGLPARFIVRYTRDGKRYLDGLYDATAEEACESFRLMARELGWRVEVESVTPRTGANVTEIRKGGARDDW